MASKDSKWIGKFYAHKSFQPKDDSGNFSVGAFLLRNSKTFKVFTDMVYIDEDFKADLGFIRRTDIVKLATSFQKAFWPKTGIINSHSFEFFPVITWRPSLDFIKTDHNLLVNW